jgi:hypothetical protein
MVLEEAEVMRPHEVAKVSRLQYEDKFGPLSLQQLFDDLSGLNAATKQAKAETSVIQLDRQGL